MKNTPHTQEELDALEVKTQQGALPPGYYANNHSLIATIYGQSNLEKKARNSFKNANKLPSYIHLQTEGTLSVGDKEVNYCLAYGVYPLKHPSE
ncbi:hypothetical protein KAI32_00550 [Candidatus Pacearchaeota archaeon]|nr:hypothetical protein [Candidatus Pacearchaeota archaeon]